MSHTIAHRPQVHIPWTNIAVVLVAVLAAVAVLVIINQPADVTDETTPVSLVAPGAVALPQLESHGEILALTGRAPAADVEPAFSDKRLNFPVGALDGVGNDGVTSPVPDTRHNFPVER